ncbi:MAG: serine/threonine protein kinase, partial [Deltaproteobacteria bacterium]|nr:serine/threonine protein kinase [Deltaproteobacteria bacterium]
MSGPEQPENDPLIGTTFADRYQLVSRLGKGGMAVVYKATDKNLGREVALKVLRKDVAADPIAAKRLIREARAAAALHHPNIITIHDVGEYAGTVYVVMEILVGKPLSDVMEEVGVLGVERSLHIAQQLLSALVAAHGQAIIHRDIKPENLFLLSAGGGDFVKVLDFSIAKLPTEMVTAALTRAGSVFGTPHYMAPEQVEGKEVGPQTDLYAVGAVVYEMISGEPPYDGASVIDILLKHVKSPAPQLSRLGIKLPTGLSDLCVRLLAKKRQDRPQTAAAVREDIARMLSEVRHDIEAVAGAVTESELGADVIAGLQAAGIMPSRPNNPTVREDHPPDAEVSAPGGRVAAARGPVEPEARTVAINTAAVTAGVVAARARAMSAGLSPVAAMTEDIAEPLSAVESLPDGLSGGPPPGDLPGAPTDLPNTPTAERRKFASIGDDSSDVRTIVGVGLGKMVAEIARQRATAAPTLHPAAGAGPAAAATAPQPGVSPQGP